MNDEELLWYERYRPEKVEDCILPERIKKLFLNYAETGEVPNLILNGPAGIGKTSVAIALCKETGLSYLLINASRERGVDTIRNKIASYASTVSFNGKRKVLILDEADNLTPDAQKALRGEIEEFSHNCSFIFTCNYKSRLIEPLHSRNAVIEFGLKASEKPALAVAMMKRLEWMLKEEGVIYEKPVLAKVIEKFFPDFRRTINELQRYSNFGAIDSGVLAQIDNVVKFEELFKFLKAKKFNEIIKWINTNPDVDVDTFYSQVFKMISPYVKPESIPPIVVLAADFQYKSALSADPTLTMIAFLTEIMVTAEWR